MSKHTPGPWWKDGRIVRPANEAHPRRAAIAACALSHGIGEAAVEDDANARLIAAAPELLEALLGLLHEDGGSLAYSKSNPACVAARAAIAKATGSAA